MNDKPGVHDLLWLKPSTDLSVAELPVWVSSVWNQHEPVIVRRDYKPDHIPVGIRGHERSQRHPFWITASDIIRRLSPQDITALVKTGQAQQKLAKFPAYRALDTLLQQRWDFEIGVTGSLAISVVSETIYVKESSDLDLTIRCNTPVEKSYFNHFYAFINTLPVQVDVQIETPSGGFSLSEWMKSPTVMLKTNCGPKLTTNPWGEEI